MLFLLNKLGEKLTMIFMENVRTSGSSSENVTSFPSQRLNAMLVMRLPIDVVAPLLDSSLEVAVDMVSCRPSKVDIASVAMEYKQSCVIFIFDFK